ncbi:hypothetical protein NO2_1600, partial [Candidatus Termititenax persephonae]
MVSFQTPILLCFFNRLETVRQTLERIRRIKPQTLYLAADGPRADCPGEKEKVQAVRDYVLARIDWPCRLQALFRDENLGCDR